MKLLSIALLLFASIQTQAQQNATGNDFAAKTVIRSLPYNIHKPGTYVLVDSLTFNSPANANAITINSNDVTLDLLGNALNNLSAGIASEAVGVFCSNHSNVTVKNGAITGFSIGILIFGSQLSSLNDTVENMRMAYNINSAISMQAVNGIVRNCEISYTGYTQGFGNQPKPINSLGTKVAIGGPTIVAHNAISWVLDWAISGVEEGVVDGNFVTHASVGIRTSDTSVTVIKNNVVNQTTTPYVGGIQVPGTNF